MTTTFQQRHYESIAKVMADGRPDDSSLGMAGPAMLRQWEETIESLASAFERDNPRFKRGKFLVACHAGEVAFRA
jgi:hypothetical protein